MIYNFFISIYFCFLTNFFLISRPNIIIRLDNGFIFCMNSLFLLNFSFTGFYRLIKFKDNLKTIEPRFPKNLRTNEARSDFTGPYKKKKCRGIVWPTREIVINALKDKGSHYCKNPVCISQKSSRCNWSPRVILQILRILNQLASFLWRM